MYKVLTIAGSDSSGGAGIQADIKTITAYGMYAMSAITSLTAQNTTGVYGIYDASTECLANQIDCIFNDIVPDAVKIGMVSNKDLIEVIAEKLKEHKAKNIVLDTVMVSTSGKKLISDGVYLTLVNKLMPLADIITPNLYEASVLLDSDVKNVEDMKAGAKKLSDQYGCSVLIKGGHLTDSAIDVLYSNGKYYEFNGVRINNDNTHGTGCTLSSAIACNIARGYSIADSVKDAKDYVAGAINDGLNLGKGSGPLNHCYRMGR